MVDFREFLEKNTTFNEHPVSILRNGIHKKELLLDTFLTNPAAPPQSYNHSAVEAQSITLPEFISDLSYSPLYTCIWAIRGVLREEGSNMQGFELSLNHVIYSFYKRGHVFPKIFVLFSLKPSVTPSAAWPASVWFFLPFHASLM